MEIYIEVASYKIKINLKLDEVTGDVKSATKRNFEISLLSYFDKFISKNKFKKADYEIDIVPYNIFRSFVTYKENTFILLFTNLSKNKVASFYQVSPYQFRFVFEYVMAVLLNESRGFVIHSSVILKNNKADLFIGTSGAGKSTISSFLAKKYTKLSDDTSYVKTLNSKFYFYEGPEIYKDWGKREARRYELGNIYFLKKAKFFKAEKIADKEKVLDTLKDGIHNLSPTSIKNLLKFVDRFNNFYTLYFDKEEKEALEFYKSL